MSRSKREEIGRWNASQVVAHNLMRARELRRLTQAEVADRLRQLTGTSWSATTVAQAEGSVSGNRVRQFTANELVALARTFDLPVLYFFLPPEDRTGEFQIPDFPRRGWPWEYLLLLVWGHRQNFAHVADRAAPWAHASTVLLPKIDLVDPDTDPPALLRLRQSRDRVKPEAMLALAINGLARKNIRGGITAGDDLDAMITSLERIIEVFKALKAYPLDTLFDAQTLRLIYGADEPASQEDEP